MLNFINIDRDTGADGLNQIASAAVSGTAGEHPETAESTVATPG
jgi:hypothetical protein